MATHVTKTFNFKKESVIEMNQLCDRLGINVDDEYLYEQPSVDAVDTVTKKVFDKMFSFIDEIRTALRNHQTSDNNDRVLGITIIYKDTASNNNYILDAFLYFMMKEAFKGISDNNIHSNFSEEEHPSYDLILSTAGGQFLSWDTMKQYSDLKTAVVVLAGSGKEATIFSNASAMGGLDVNEYRFVLTDDYDENIDMVQGIYDLVADKHDFLRKLRHRIELMHCME